MIIDGMGQALALIFRTIQDNRTRLTEASNEILEYKQYFSDTDVKRIHKELKVFTRDEQDFNHSLSKLIQVGHPGKASEDAAVAELMEEFEQSGCSSSMVNSVIEGYQALSRLMDSIFILAIPKALDYTAVQQSHDWNIFRLLREDNEDARFFIHDESIISTSPLPEGCTGPAIIKYSGGQRVSDQDAFRPSILRPSVKLCKTEFVTRVERIKLADNALRMPCPLSHEGDCHSGALRWVCLQCEEVLLYEYDGFVYCRCGKTLLDNCTFRCNSIAHGYQYMKLHDLSIRSIREKMRPGDDEINILLLGETGVGKSTFINAFANYLRYDSLEIAERMEMTTLIQSSFEIEGTKVTAGKPDQNEKLKGGQSSTQYCRSYVFPLNEDVKVRLIDTPGIGDTRGVRQDRINFEEIMDYISGFDKINGVCILLLPDTPRLTTSFRFCIDELLLHLHKSAADNVIFTFTKTRSSFYGPGDTMTPLKTYMKELERESGIAVPLDSSNMFFFDNESFRLYAALKQGISFDQNTKDAFGASWIKSVDEARRLIKRVVTLTPHKTTETVTLDVARRSVLLLAPAMAKINENITIEVKDIRNLRTEAQNNKISAEGLKTKLLCSYMDLDPINLTHPRTVCTSPSCTTIYDKIVRYNKHCHTNCYLTNIAINVINHAGLRDCDAMRGAETCRVCGCRWEKHMHVKIDYNEVKKQKTDTAVEKQLKEKLSAVDAMQQAIAEADERIKILESEKKVIFDSLMTFTGFLLQNSILVQNTGILAYIDMSIENQERIAQRTKDFAILESLRAQRNDFVAQTEIMEKAIKDGMSQAAKIAPSQVVSARESLCRLKINGQALTMVLDWGKQNQAQLSKRETRIADGYVSGGWSWSSTLASAKSSMFKRLGFRRRA
ncbi:hypothetical protein BGZ72_003676 [Mortierella alpina]|nr:hypothetical protein BGZ72_003676 [Mortierella alpina]